MTLLSPEQLQIRQEAKAFVARHIMPAATALDRSGEFHPFLMEEAKASQFLDQAAFSGRGDLRPSSPIAQ